MPSQRFSEPGGSAAAPSSSACSSAGAACHGRYLTLIVAPNAAARDAGSASSPARSSAARSRRNRAKRLIREVFRRHSRPAGRAVDVVVMPRRELLRCAVRQPRSTTSDRRSPQRAARREPLTPAARQRRLPRAARRPRAARASTSSAVAAVRRLLPVPAVVLGLRARGRHRRTARSGRVAGGAPPVALPSAWVAAGSIRCRPASTGCRRPGCI